MPLKRQACQHRELRVGCPAIVDSQLYGNGEFFEFGKMILGGTSRTTSDNALLKVLADQLLSLVFEYSEALAMYRANIDANFEFRAHKSRVEMFVRFLEGKQSLLDDGGTSLSPSKVSLGLIRQHLSDNQPG